MDIQRTARLFQIALFVLFGVLGFSACNYNDIKNAPGAFGKPGGPGDQSSAAVVDYATVKDKVFASACLKCHGDQVARASLRLDTYAATFPNIAKIRSEVESGNMPPPPPRGAVLSVEQRAMLLAWIDSGAPETTVVSPAPTQPATPPDTSTPAEPPTTTPAQPVPPSEPAEVPDFNEVSRAVFIPHCVKCHSNDGAKGGVNLEDYENAAKHASEIGFSLDTDDMPRRAPALDSKLKMIVYAWIAGGTPAAKTNAATAPAPVPNPNENQNDSGNSDHDNHHAHD